MEKYIVLIAGWAVYFSIHSILAADKTKLFFKTRSGKLFSGYRIIYNLIALAGLLFMMALNGIGSTYYLLSPNGFTRYLSLLLATIGVLILRAAFKQYQIKNFIGIAREDDEQFKADGILKHIRHPLYSATILLVLGFWIFVPTVASLISAACIFIYLAISIPLEEQKLTKKYGEGYRIYKKNVPALIPKIRIGSQ